MFCANSTPSQVPFLERWLIAAMESQSLPCDSIFFLECVVNIEIGAFQKHSVVQNRQFSDQLRTYTLLSSCCKAILLYFFGDAPTFCRIRKQALCRRIDIFLFNDYERLVRDRFCAISIAVNIFTRVTIFTRHRHWRSCSNGGRRGLQDATPAARTGSMGFAAWGDDASILIVFTYRAW